MPNRRKDGIYMLAGHTVEDAGSQRVRPQDADLSELHSFLLEIDRLKQVNRQNPIATGPRAETTAEHSWHLSVAVLIFARFASETLDVNAAVTLAAVHDIPEVFVGDTFVYSPQINSRHKNEVTAMRQMVANHRNSVEVKDIFDKWKEYEELLSPEGRFVMALDVLLPVFLNYSNLEFSSWRAHHVRADQVQRRIDGVREYCPELADFASQVVCDAARLGVLRPQKSG
ncbi:MAG TPA: HD domain-containing protein [Pseudonocardiaceae bacterium]